MPQAHGLSIWRESAGSGAVPTATHLVHRFDAGLNKWVLVAGVDAEAQLLDLDGTGKYVLVDVRTEYVLAALSPTKVTPQVGAAAAAVLTRPASTYVAVAVGAGVQAARHFVGTPLGKLRLVANDARELLLVLIGSKARSY